MMLRIVILLAIFSLQCSCSDPQHKARVTISLALNAERERNNVPLLDENWEIPPSRTNVLVADNPLLVDRGLGYSRKSILFDGKTPVSEESFFAVSEHLENIDPDSDGPALIREYATVSYVYGNDASTQYFIVEGLGKVEVTFDEFVEYLKLKLNWTETEVDKAFRGR